MCAFVDFESPRQWPWRSKKMLRRACARIDSYVLFPDDVEHAESIVARLDHDAAGSSPGIMVARRRLSIGRLMTVVG